MKKLIIIALVLSSLCGAVLITHSQTVRAVTNNNNLVDDFTFDDTTTLSAAQIDNWLNVNFPNSCISTNSGFTSSDPAGYAPSYPHADGQWSYGSPVSAGRVIYDAAIAHGLNPEVLITKLQNEEQLVDGSAGCGSTWRYASAVGYACTDSDTFSHNYSYTGADPFSDSSALPTPLYYRNGVAVNSISGSCVNHNVYAGFSEQLVHAAWALSIWQHKSEGQTSWAAINGSWNHCDDINTCPGSMNIPAGWACYGGFMTQGTFKRCPTDSNAIFYDGYATIDGQSIHMDDGATAALYVYTPHIQSFDNIFNAYFGSQYAFDSFTPHPDGTVVAMGARVYLIDNGTKRWITSPDVFTSYGYPWFQVKASTTGDGGLPDGSPINTLAPGTLFVAANSPVYVITYENGSLVEQQVSLAAFNSLGYNWNEVLHVAPGSLPTPVSSTVLFANQHPAGTLVSGVGKIYLLDQTSKRWILGPDAFATNNFYWNKVKAATSSDLGLPDGTPLDLRQGNILFSSNNIYVVDYDGSGILKQPLGPWECFANRWHYAPRDLYQIAPGSMPSRTGSLATC